MNRLPSAPPCQRGLHAPGAVDGGSGGWRGMAKASEVAAKVLRVVRESGGSYRQIAAALNERGIATAQCGAGTAPA